MTNCDPNDFEKIRVPSGMQPADPALPREQILGGRYRVLSLLGRGGMGVVYRVEEILLKRELALKTIDKSAISDNSIRRFQSEARIAFGINHPNIISVYDFGLLEDSTPFMAMELVSGISLSDHLKTSTLTLEEAVPLFAQVCHGLAHAHNNGVVHRDIKPSNIMLVGGSGSAVKILDFGIAKLTQLDAGHAQALTRTGEIFGSPLYMSPEQCSGVQIDHRTDIYSLGCVIFEALSGTPPFVGENALSTMMMHQNAEIPTLREASLGKKFPAELENLLQKMLAKDPADRYQNLTKVAQDLAALISGKTSNTQSATYKDGARTIQKAVAPQKIDNTVSLSRIAFGASIVATAVSSVVITVGLFAVYTASRPLPVPAKATPEIMDSAVSYSDATGPDPSKQVTVGQTKREFSGVLDEDTIKALANDKDVQDLGINNCPIQNSDLAYLTHLKLVDLCIKQCDVENFDEVSKIKTLQRLEVENLQTQPTEEEVEKVAHMPNLKLLNLKHGVVSEKALRRLAKSESLVWIDLPESPTGAYSKEFLIELGQLMPQCGFSPFKQPRINSLISQKTEAIKDHEKHCIESIEIAKKVNPNLSIIPKSLTTLATLSLAKHRNAEARQQIEEALRILTKTGNDSQKVEALIVASGVYNALGDTAADDKVRAEALKLAQVSWLHDSSEFQDVMLIALGTPLRNRDLQGILKLCDEAIANGSKSSRVSMRKVSEFFEIAGWQSFLLGDKVRARKYFDAEVKYLQPNEKKYPRAYLRALASQTRSNEGPDQQEKLKNLVEQIEKMQIPEDCNLNVSYYDCCATLSNLLATKPESLQESVSYLRKALDHLKTLRRHPHVDARYDVYVNTLIQRLNASGKSDEAKQILLEYPLRQKKDDTH